MTTINTIGHSVAPIERIIELLRDAEIKTLVDVRSIPYIRRVPTLTVKTSNAPSSKQV